MTKPETTPETPAQKGKDIATKARVELKPADKEGTPKSGSVHSYKNAAGTTIATRW